MSGLKIEYPGLASSLHASVREHIKTLERSVRHAELVTAKLRRTTPMAEEQAIPPRIMADAIACIERARALDSGNLHLETIAAALLAAELRGRTEQIEADARLAEIIFSKGTPAGAAQVIATAIRSQS